MLTFFIFVSSLIIRALAKTEKEVGQAAARMLKADLQRVISSSGLTMTDRKKESIRNASASFRMVKGDPKLLKGVAVLMPKHGFVQNYGVNTTRTGHILKIGEKGKFFKRKQHSFKMKATPILDELVKSTAAIKFVEDEVLRLRGEDFVLNIKRHLEA